MVKTTEYRAKFGTSEPPAKKAILKAGPLAAAFQGGGLADIRHDGIEVLRGISFLVRDENWGTCPARVSGLKITKRKDGFSVSYRATAENAGAKLTMQASIRATPQQLVFHVSATPDKDFKTNRTGFVVLHPINGVAGKPLSIIHTDGKVQRARFPRLISPGQPFFNIRALEHAPAPGLKAKVLMEGPKFEMEDQRNWSDASYKTYVCSLLDPWPYVLPAGKTIEQRITLDLRGKAKDTARSNSISTASKMKLPEIGIAIGPSEAAEALRRLNQLRALAPQHLTFTLHDGEDMEAAAMAYGALAQQTSIPVCLEIVLPGKVSAELEMAKFAGCTQRAGLEPARVVVTQSHDLKSFQPTDKRPWGPSYEEMAAAARKHFPRASIGGGMITYFTELNRKRPPQGVFDFITHAICPIVHDASDEAVMQTLESLPHIFASAKAFIGKTPYHLGPSSIGARFNPYGAALAANPKSRRVCLAPNDPRQFATFAVDWNKGVIEAAARAGLKSVTLSALTGPRGLLDKSGRPTPLYKQLARLMRQARKSQAAQQTAKPAASSKRLPPRAGRAHDQATHPSERPAHGLE
ncbi:MAG: hypothetical protein KGO53_01805 [Alphaproteobacteria bacterium]|nr:hypothetical protein [Alphaproteobacteria bacterium]